MRIPHQLLPALAAPAGVVTDGHAVCVSADDVLYRVDAPALPATSSFIVIPLKSQ